MFEREIKSVLYLSKIALSSGYTIVIGDRQSFLKKIDSLPIGILFINQLLK